MQEASPPVTKVTQAVEGEGNAERIHKRTRPTVGDRVFEDERPRRSWKDAVASPTLLPGNFQFSVENMLDRANVLMEGPWKIMDHYITVEMASQFCGKLVGNPLKIDYHTVWSTRGRFARICVEIDLGSPLLSKVRMGKRVYNIEYEGLHSICFNCGVVGHRVTDCFANQKVNPTNKEVNREPQVQENQERREDDEHEYAQHEEKELAKDRYGPWIRDTSVSRILAKRVEQCGTKGSNNSWGKFINVVMEPEVEVNRMMEYQEKPPIEVENVTCISVFQAARDMEIEPIGPEHADLGNKNFNRNCRDLIREENPTMICLLETKAKSGTGTSLQKKLKFENHFEVPSQGFRGCLILLWNSKAQEVTIRQHTNQVIHCEIKEDDKSWLLSTVYIQPHSLKKEEAWENIYAYSIIIDQPWMIVGDFNDFSTLDERIGSNSDCLNRIIKFREHWNRCNLMDASYVGSKFTWTKHLYGRVTLQERLDKLLHNVEMVDYFPNLIVITLTRVYSDHNPILINTSLEIPVDIEKRPFRFEATWLTHEDFNRAFRVAWDKKKDSLVDAVEETKKALIDWKENTFGDIFKRKKTMVNRIQRSTNYFYSIYLQELEKILDTDYQQVLEQEEILWHKKSRLDWFLKGERNTKFFHLKTIVRSKFNKIVGLFIGDDWITEKTTLCQHVCNFYKGLFAGKEYVQLSRDYDSFIPRLNEEERTELMNQVTMKEVKVALFNMKGLKAPGPDDIQPIFYKQNWDTVKNTLRDFANNTLELGKMDTRILRTFLMLILKTVAADNVTQFRPISLLNTSYKIFSKVVVRHLCPVFQRLIGPYQNSFMKGRSTSDNILIVQEAVNSMMNLKGRKGAMIAKIDLQKAYDNVSWEFLKKTLQDFNFPERLVETIMFCITSYSIEPLWNGEITKILNPKQGLRQGDPLSPYLFILFMERLSHIIMKKVEKGLWKPFQCSRGGVKLMLPVLISKKLDIIDSNFLWGGDIENAHNHLVSWDKVCRSKKMEGLGIRKARLMNIALMAKNNWKLLTKQENLWCKVSEGKYLKHKEFLETESKGNSSSTWRGLLRTRNLIKQGRRWHIKSEVASYIDDDRSWNIRGIQHLLSYETKMEIGRVLIPQLSDPHEQDINTWGFSKDSQFTVTSAYQIMSIMEMGGHHGENLTWDLAEEKLPFKEGRVGGIGMESFVYGNNLGTVEE
ncbi:hypothetical protein F3Y22_tig00112495pilonHSYRG00083 [Hibiscus syriacus]|uniref:CCHC-type domain-containing protein n=1 Tax=Hibiscus syriacus TaxID=106335 RepID=A0A6A2Y751_HIBSY|nr:hypothetical protein F3Y22_tig00112495pilonHSYRG00083 [Hibiscus syriacus]